MSEQKTRTTNRNYNCDRIYLPLRIEGLPRQNLVEAILGIVLPIGLLSEILSLRNHFVCIQGDFGQEFLVLRGNGLGNLFGDALDCLRQRIEST